MPNWTYNAVQAHDPAADAVLNKFCIDADGDFTLQKLRTMPVTLRLTKVPLSFVGSKDEVQGRIHHCYPHFAEQGFFVRESNYSPSGDSTAVLTRACASSLERRFGASDWYQWAERNWGVKWDVSHSSRDPEGIWRFDTPWTEPREFIEALAKLVPKGSCITWFVDYEDGGSADYTLTDGEFNVEYGDGYDSGDDDSEDNDG